MPFASPPVGLHAASSSGVGSATACALPIPALVVEADGLHQQRQLRILQHLGYTADAVLFAASVAAARTCLAALPVALAVVDIVLPDGNGFELIAELRKANPGACILVVTARCTEDAILGALCAGATGYVLKEREDFEIALSIRSVLRGGVPIDPFLVRSVLAQVPCPQAERANTAVQVKGVLLTVREAEMLRLVADGLSNQAIAARCFLSRYTVESHIKHIYRKLGVSSRTMAVREAMARGLIS